MPVSRFARKLLAAPIAVLALGLAATPAFAAAHPEDLSFSAYPDHPQVGQSVDLYAYATGTDVSYSWDLNGDGLCETTPEASGAISTTFGTAGDKDVKVCAQEAGGDSAFKLHTLRVHSVNHEPSVDFYVYASGYYYGDDYRARSGRAATFYASGYDDDSDSGSVLSYSWDLDGDGVFGDDVGAADGGSDEAPIHTYASPGHVDVGVMVTDDDGASSIARHTVQVTADNRPPEVYCMSADPSTTVAVGQEVQVQGCAYDYDGTVTDIAWDLDGDGSFETPGDASVYYSTQPVSFGTAGDHIVRFRATDDEGAERTEVLVINVGRPNSAPFGDLYTSPAEPRTGQTVTLDAYTETVGTPTYSWDLNGDGVFGDATGAEVTKTYATAGDVEVSVDATLGGTTVRYARVVHVHATNDEPSVYASFDTSQSGCYYGYYYGCSNRVLTNHTVSMYGNAWDLDGSITAYQWAFGDGATQTIPGPDPDPTTSHSYTTAGAKLVGLTATDDSGASSKAAYTLHVHDVNEAPDVYIAGADYWYAGTGDLVDLYAYAYDDGSVQDFAWDLDDDGQFDDATGDTVLDHVFGSEGDHVVRVRVTDDLGASSVQAESVHIHFNTAVKPINYDLPTVTGTATNGQLLTGHAGSWDGTPTITYAYQWMRCTDSTVGSCSAIPGATATTYTLTGSDIGNRIRLRERATNGAGSTDAYSNATAVVASGPPANTGLPVVSGSLIDGRIVSGTDGTWSGNPSFTYQWQRCTTTDAATCSDIGAATTSSYRLVPADIGNRVRLKVTGTNGAGSADAFSAISAAVVAGVPLSNTAPVITGSPVRDGTMLSVSNGTWYALDAGATYGYQWQRCGSSDPATCDTIAGATGSTYVLTSGDVGKIIMALVTATDAQGASAPARSAGVGPVTALAPANSSLPQITGTATDGQQLTASNGTWTGTTPLTYTRQWRRCTSTSVDSCSDISGATGTQYTLTPSDIGAYIRVVVTATNSVGAVSATSSAAGPVAAIPAQNSIKPAISGLAEVGESLASTLGTWTGSPTITYARQWRRCDSSGANCIDIGGATGTNYTVQAADAGSTLRVRVTATNAAGPVSADSDPTAVVVAVAPHNESLPVVTGTTTDGFTLTGTQGTWSGGPTSFARQWLRCTGTALDSCSEITGETAATHDLVPADVGSRLRLRVTATNDYGSTPAVSDATAVIAAAQPANSALPQLTGTLVQGQTVHVSDGTWTGSPAITFAYQWQRCSGTDAASCADIAGATGADHVVEAADVGQRLRARVRATNGGGSTNAFTAISAVVEGPPVNVTAPAVTGTATEGQTLTGSDGSWSGTPAPALGRQWLRCSGATADTCAAIAGATGTSYLLAAADVGQRIALRVTATNSRGAASADSAPTAVVAAKPATVDPSAELKGLANAITRVLANAQSGGKKGVDPKNPVLALGQIGPQECPQGCLVTMLVQLAGGKASAVTAKLAKLGAAKVTVAKGATSKLKVKLNKKAAKLLRKKHRLAAKVTVTLASTSGAKSKGAKTVTVKARRKKK